MNIRKVSVITLTYNNYNLLPIAIESVKNQFGLETVEVEHIILDDGTVNFDLNHVERYFYNYPFKYRILQNITNIGTVKSLNRAIIESRGDVIILLPADDEFYDSFVVHDIIKEFNSSGAKIITAVRVPIIDGKENTPLPLEPDRDIFLDRYKLIHRLAFKGNFISGASTYYKRDLFNEIGLFDESYRLLEDYPFLLKALSMNIDINFLNRKTIKYGTNGISNGVKLNHTLMEDNKKAVYMALKLGVLNFWEKRVVVYTRIYDKREKMYIINVLKFPDQFLRLLILYFCKLIKIKGVETKNDS
jgi:glycosyltransferase involved in cell wall biosynthesis